MLGAIYVGLSGMNAYSRGLQTISNNVANLNTNGFRATSVSFSDWYSVDSNGWSYQGGQHATGQGVQINDPITDFRPGELRSTENDLDLALNGNGFLVLLNEGRTYFARTGQFAVDKDGYIADKVTGYRLGVLDASNQPVAVNINGSRTLAPVESTKITFADNLSSSATSASITGIAVYDDRGGKHTWSVTFSRSTTTEDWNVVVKDESSNTIGSSTLKFIGSVVDPSADSFTVTLSPAGAGAMAVELDFSSSVTSFSGGTTSTIRAANIDGNATGDLKTVTVDDSGHVKIVYSNEKEKLMGAVAIADFLVPQDLKHESHGLFVRDDNADMRLLSSGVEGIGKLVSKQLEASNVNLSDEFGRLILVQRGYQACSQVLSISNDMIQQLFGIRGQS